MVAYSNSCVCGKSEANNCAHYLTNWLIQNGEMEENPSGTVCCSSGRPIRAREVRGIWIDKFGKAKFNDPGFNCHIYCEKPHGQGSPGHVYYGTKSNCPAGTGASTDFSGYTYVEYYYYDEDDDDSDISG